MSKREVLKDSYIGFEPIRNYYLTEKIDEGRIGSVYKAVQSDPLDVLACKVIPVEKLRDGWDRELEKVLQLRGVPNVVQYITHDSGLDNNNKPFVWILWNYVDGINLRDYLNTFPWPLDMAFIENIIRTSLKAFHACYAIGIQHGDLHEGNILISKPDKRLPGSPRTIWVSDFGYGGSHIELEPKDDYRQLFSITSNMLKKLDISSLDPRDRIMHQKIEEFVKKKILEVDSLQGMYVGNPQELLIDFNTLGPIAEREAAAATKEIEFKEPGDYLVAEALGYRADEWKNLFVPEFLAAQDLLSKNITVLTGARGCGKTMTFRRLTVFMDKIIGESSGVRGADQFIGFYLNCRDLVEAFPWLPPRLNRGMKQQIMHYFHLSWFSEICKTLAIYDENYKPEEFEWLDGFLKGIFGGIYYSLPMGSDVLTHTRAFIDNEKERCRLVDIGKESGIKSWPLAEIDFLDRFQNHLESHVSWIGQKPIYLFLDDYTVPIVTRNVQHVLNPIIFKRRSNLFFKISTEATNSFEKQGLHGKPLELHQDFELIDLATESIHQDPKGKAKLLDKIFRPRIDRHSCYHEKSLGLEDILGKMPRSNNKLATVMREAVSSGQKEKILYHGANAFAGMWTSDTRIMIQMFTDILREANGDIREGEIQIKPKIQDRVYRAAGGEFLVFTESVKDPSLWEKESSSIKPKEVYGRRLKDIAEAFVKVSRYELTEGPLISNQGRRNPKQAFRLEIIDKFDLPKKAMSYYEGLIRWHIFLQDWRGKSVRGMITPRLYLNRVLIPYSYLTFSSHDNIQLNNEEFIQLLEKPKDFPTYWIRKRKGDKNKKLSEY
jgi:serine/threonine protein kinase